MFKIKVISLFLALFVAVGCQEQVRDEVDYPARITELESQLAQAKADIDQKDKQIKQLQGLKEPVAELITQVEKVSLGRYSRLEDKNNDNLIDNVVIYLQLYDDSADLIKVSGSLTVELWDLNAPDKNLVHSWQFAPDELEPHWDGGLLADHYRIDLPVNDYKSAGDLLSLKCNFIESLNGKNWELQEALDIK